jgi:hypothetical protein
MISDTFQIYRNLRNTSKSNQPWMKLREEYTWLQQEAKSQTSTQPGHVQKNQSFLKR